MQDKNVFFDDFDDDFDDDIIDDKDWDSFDFDDMNFDDDSEWDEFILEHEKPASQKKINPLPAAEKQPSMTESFEDFTRWEDNDSSDDSMSVNPVADGLFKYVQHRMSDQRAVASARDIPCVEKQQPIEKEQDQRNHVTVPLALHHGACVIFDQQSVF